MRQQVRPLCPVLLAYPFDFAFHAVVTGQTHHKLMFKEISIEFVIEDWVNNYPRKILGYKSAYQIVA